MDDQALLVTTYELAGAPASVIQRIFELDAGGRVARFGTWSSRPKAGPVPIDDLRSWTRFTDYIMEGGVQYDLRIADHQGHLLLEVRKLGLARDPHVDGFTEWSLDQLGVKWTRVSDASGS